MNILKKILWGLAVIGGAISANAQVPTPPTPDATTLTINSTGNTINGLTIGSGLSLSGGVLTVTAGGGNVSAAGSITVGQTAQWSSATTIIAVMNTGSGSYVLSSSPSITTPSITGAISFPSNTRQAFAPGSTVAGLNVGSVSSNPSTLVNGDLWYNSTSNTLQAQINGSTVSISQGMTNPFTTTGDMVYASSGSTPGRLAIGSTGQILTVVGGVPAWASASGGGNVSNTGTPTNGQIGVWTGATTLSGVTNLTLPGTINGMTLSSSTGTFTLANSKTLKVDNTLELAGTDSTKFTFPGASDTVAALGTAQIFTAVNTFSNTTNASTSLVGAVVIGNGTSSTSVGIGAGNINVGTNVTLGGVINALGSVNVLGTTGGTGYLQLGQSSTQLNNWLIGSEPGNGRLVFYNGVYGGTLNIGGYFNSTSFTLGNGIGLSVPGTTTLTGNVTVNGTETFTPNFRTSGTTPYAQWTIPSDTGLTAATEAIGFKVVTQTRTWATTGTVVLQREFFWAGPTYASASASQTFTDVFTGYMTPPVEGTNAIFTREHTFGIVDSTSSGSAITGGFIVATTLGTSATSVGIGGGNINAGGNGTFGGTLGVTGLLTASGGVSSTTLFQSTAAYNGGLLMGNTAAAPSNQLYSYAAGNTGLISGGYFNSSSQRVANVTNPAEVQVYNGQVQINANTGATVASVYSTNTVATFSATSLTLGSGVSLSVPGTSTLTGNVTVGGSGAGVLVYPYYSVSGLPSASSYTYGIVFVTDSTSAPTTGQGSAPSGSGSYKRPVYSNGTSWLQL